jgi:hypothetical protein
VGQASDQANVVGRAAGRFATAIGHVSNKDTEAAQPFGSSLS